MNTIEVIIKSSDGYDMDWKLSCDPEEQDHLAEVIRDAVEVIQGRYRELT